MSTRSSSSEWALLAEKFRKGIKKRKKRLLAMIIAALLLALFYFLFVRGGVTYW